MANVNATLKIGDNEIPDFKSWEVYEKLGIAEVAFNANLDRPTTITTDDLASISYSIGSGQPIPLITNKKIEITGQSTQAASFRGEGSVASRRGPFRTIYFINQTWLKAIYPNAYIRDSIIYAQDPGSSPIQYKGVSANRLYIPELPGKEVKDIEFECYVRSGISYMTIAQYIAKRIGYTINTNLPDMYVQKTFVINSGEPWFEALARLYAIFWPMTFIKDGTIYILDIGGDDQAKPSKTISLSEKSFSVLNYSVDDTQQIVDHVLLQGPTSNFLYSFQSTASTLRIKRSAATLPGITQVLVSENEFQAERSEYVAELQKELGSSGVTISEDQVFEYMNQSADRNGRNVTTTKTKVNTITGETATIYESIETYNIGGDLVHRVETKHSFADYRTPVGTTKLTWQRFGVLEGGISEQNVNNYKLTIPSQYELRLQSAEIVRYGAFIGDTGLYEADIDHYELCVYQLDQDTVDDVDVMIKQKPQRVSRNNMIGITPAFWEAPDDPTDTTTGPRYTFMLVQRERVRFDKKSASVLRKRRFVEEFLPIYHNYVLSEDINVRRFTPTNDQVQTKWEYYKVPHEDGTYSVMEYTGGQPPSTMGVDPESGLPMGYHPKLTLSCPDLIDGTRALRIAKRIFAKRQQKNTMATIKTVIPIPGLKVGHVIQLPSCTKQYMDWDTKLWATVTLTGEKLWVVGVRTRCENSGEVGSSVRGFTIYQEIELKKNF